ncbi:MAG: hypothetical protein A3D47_00420 [Candidatus Colwellbacteria bacterium RIFCSPHIGHO2_02_FULL_43_15]|uniref:Prepilin-type N-terminal cleavage/methylation domain-containing protein n=2 Tax=Candidatus Colwelliibacteriota TaxID=1817904 RepID=A0A1G1YXL5_9BACT|nr:MAG: hypothetical protein A3D47_00420 [Candidatus Colwellbacteria bacterium RIFCSPHIGHO2_02_FULL_43_15]OGY60641.1 MAG: hypothetical protein A3F99_01415 [Candidatus Colwellbacteria bacterium RIFCSPLOWO2_12_FULL_43_11]
MKDRKLKSLTGFTIIELMVATALFLVLVAVATGTFVQTLKIQRTITELAAANDNATQAVEQMSREIRTGFNFVGSTNTILKFVNYRSEQVNYKLIGNSISRCAGSCQADTDFLPITAPEVKVEKLNFTTSGIDLTDNFPPRITITLSIPGPRGIKVNLQTTVSSRVIEPEF